MADAAGYYVIETDVEAELSCVIGAESQPTSTELNDFIADIEGEVNGYLYSVGVTTASIASDTTPIVFRVVKQWALWGICSRVLAAMGGSVNSQMDKEEWYWSRYQLKRDEILANPAVLGSDTPFTSAAGSLGVAGVADDDDDAHDRKFAMDDEY